MIDWFSIGRLINDVEIDFNFGHHLVNHMSDMITVHRSKIVYSWKVRIDERLCHKLAPLCICRYRLRNNLSCERLFLLATHLWIIHDLLEVLVFVNTNIDFRRLRMSGQKFGS
jgi:hypothetical protein